MAPLFNPIWKVFKLILNTILILFITISKSYSLIEVDITRGNLNPLPIAVSPLFQDNNSNTFFEKELEIKDLGSEISKVIENNLKQSGLFNPLSKDAFLQKPDIAHLKPRFEDWALIKSQALITGKVTATSGQIAGFTIDGDTLTATNFTLDAAGKRVTLGTGNDIFIADGDEGIQLGNATFGLAPFSVTKGGVLKAVAGTVGGYGISATAISSSNNNLILNARKINEIIPKKIFERIFKLLKSKNKG